MLYPGRIVKQRRDQLNKMCSIRKTPGSCDGCQVDFEDTMRECLQQFVCQNPDFDFANNRVKIKFSGDGAQMTKNTNFIILSLAILGEGKTNNALSETSTHRLAVVKETESCFEGRIF